MRKLRLWVVTQLERGGTRTVIWPSDNVAVGMPVPIHRRGCRGSERWEVAWGAPARKWNQILCLRLLPLLKNPQDCCPRTFEWGRGNKEGHFLENNCDPCKAWATDKRPLGSGPWTQSLEQEAWTFWHILPTSHVLKAESDISALMPGFCQPSQWREKTEPALPSGSFWFTWRGDRFCKLTHIYVFIVIGVLKQGSSTPGPWTGTCRRPVRNWATQQESEQRASKRSFVCRSPSFALLPEPYLPTPNPVRGKMVFHETGPWCQKGWGPLF